MNGYRDYCQTVCNMITVETALPGDAAEITRIKTEAYNKEINTWLGRNGGPPGYDQVESELEIIRNNIAYKIMLDGNIIGAFFLYREGSAVMHFEDFVIKPEHQGKGYGYRVLCLVEKKYPEISEWRLSTPVFSIGNQHLYEKFGYVETSRNRDEIFYRKSTGPEWK